MWDAQAHKKRFSVWNNTRTITRHTHTLAHTAKSQTIWRLFVANNIRKHDTIVIPISYIIQFYPIIKSKRTSHTKSQIDRKKNELYYLLWFWIKQRIHKRSQTQREELEMNRSTRNLAHSLWEPKTERKETGVRHVERGRASGWWRIRMYNERTMDSSSG